MADKGEVKKSRIVFGEIDPKQLTRDEKGIKLKTAKNEQKKRVKAAAELAAETVLERLHREAVLRTQMSANDIGTYLTSKTLTDWDVISFKSVRDIVIIAILAHKITRQLGMVFYYTAGEGLYMYEDCTLCEVTGKLKL